MNESKHFFSLLVQLAELFKMPHVTWLCYFLLTEATTPFTAEATTGPPITPSPFEPPTLTWKVKDDKDNVCMIMQFGARFVIKYTDTKDKVSSDKKCKVFPKF